MSDHDTRPDITPLMDACRQGDLIRARRLLLEGAEVNAANRNGTTPLMYAKTAAIGSGDISLLRLLIAHGADVNARDNRGRTALEYLESNTTSVITFLKENGATR